MLLPSELEIDVYRNIHPDIKHMTDEQLLAHYQKFGRDEGRQANRLKDRNDFAALIPNDLLALEIGPFANPIKQGDNVHYADFLGQAELIERALKLGIKPERVPVVHHILSETPLNKIDVHYDAVISSHCIEHQPDLIKHLTDVHSLVQANAGRYFLLIPDKRYCFDRFIAESTIADILEAHEAQRIVHTLKSVIEHRALITANNATEHWKKTQKGVPKVDPAKVNNALKEWRNAQGAYIDVHAWYFTPDSFAEIISLLNKLSLIDLEVERLYPTRRFRNEFWAILKCR